MKKKREEIEEKVLYFIILALICDYKEIESLLSARIEYISDIPLRTIKDKIIEFEQYLEPKSEQKEIIKALYEYISNGSNEIFFKSNFRDITNIFLNSFKGIPISILQQYYDISKLLSSKEQLIDLPIHGYIFDSKGITSEYFILISAFHYFTKAKMYMERYQYIFNKDYINKLDENDRFVFLSLYDCLRDYSIQAFINYMTFIECFVNSVSYNFVLKNPNMNIELKNILSENKNIIDIRKKLLVYPDFIKNNRHNQVLLNEQIKYEEKSDSFYGSNFCEYSLLVENRNSFIHYSPNPDTKKPKKTNIVESI